MSDTTDSTRATPIASPFPTGTLLGAIDIGSNSIKLTVGRLTAAGTLEEILWRSEVVRLGAGLEQTGALAPDRIDAAIAALATFRVEAEARGAVGIVAVATEATRAAANSDELLARAAAEAGVLITVIGGDAEAELSFRGLAVATDIRGTVLVGDIGGGSTELIFAEQGDLLRSGSVGIGSGRLTDLYVTHDPPRRTELATCEEVARAGLAFLHDQVQPEAVAGLRLILVGGTGEYLGRMVPDGARITAADIDAVLEESTHLTVAALAARLAIPALRAQVLPAGFAIVAALRDLSQPATITVGRSGIRAGLLLEAFAGRWPVERRSEERSG